MKVKLFALAVIVIIAALTVAVSEVLSQSMVVVQIYLPVILKDYPELPKPSPTPVLTATAPFPTQTASPTATPSPTSQPPTGVHVLPNHSTYHLTSFNGRVVVGEVLNNLAINIEFVKITVRFFNSSGNLLDQDFGYTTLDTLHAGEKTCFNIIFLNEPSGWSYYEFDPVSYWTTSASRPNITLLSHSGGVEPIFGWYRILGEVRNDHGSNVEFVMPVFTLYDSTGIAVDCDYTFADPHNLEPGQTSPFENYSVLRDDYSDVTNYRIQIDGKP